MHASATPDLNWPNVGKQQVGACKAIIDRSTSRAADVQSDPVLCEAKYSQYRGACGRL